MNLDESNETNTDSTRKLASIKIVNNVIEHKNANSLELSIIEGWQVVTRVGEVKKGDKVIYCEIDSLLPNAPWLPEAIKGKIGNDTQFRLRTMKLRGEISQGLIVPISETIRHMTEYEVDTDVTAELRIQKYEAPTFSGSYANNKGKTTISTFPKHLLNKTDEPRIQSNLKLLKLINGREYYITVKCDGSSGTFLIDPNTDEFIVCSRNQIRPRPVNIEECPYWSVAIKYDIETKLRQYGKPIALQGEVCGPKIQKNLLNLGECDLFVFNIIDLATKSLLPYNDFILIVKQMGLQSVPIEKVGDSFEIDDVKTLLSMAEGKYKNTKNQREGLVVRTQNGRVSFKVISNAYLLKYE